MPLRLGPSSAMGCNATLGEPERERERERERESESGRMRRVEQEKSREGEGEAGCYIWSIRFGAEVEKLERNREKSRKLKRIRRSRFR